MKTSETVGSLFTALAIAQRQFKPLKKTGFVKGYAGRDGKPGRPDRYYSTLADIVESTSDALSENGLALPQNASVNGATQTIEIESLLTHSSGEWIEFFSVFPIAFEERTPVLQSAGGAVTYAIRYTRRSILCPPGDDGDDNDAEGTGTGTGQQKSHSETSGSHSQSQSNGQRQPPVPVPAVDVAQMGLTKAWEAFWHHTQLMGIDTKLSTKAKLKWIDFMLGLDEATSELVGFDRYKMAQVNACNDALYNYLVAVNKVGGTTEHIGWEFLSGLFETCYGHKPRTVYHINNTNWAHMANALITAKEGADGPGDTETV